MKMYIIIKLLLIVLSKLTIKNYNNPGTSSDMLSPGAHVSGASSNLAHNIFNHLHHFLSSLHYPSLSEHEKMMRNVKKANER